MISLKSILSAIFNINIDDPSEVSDYIREELTNTYGSDMVCSKFEDPGELLSPRKIGESTTEWFGFIGSTDEFEDIKEIIEDEIIIGDYKYIIIKHYIQYQHCYSVDYKKIENERNHK